MKGVAVDRRDLLRAAARAAVAGALAGRPAGGLTRSTTRYAALERLLEEMVAGGEVPGGAVAVVRPGRFRPDVIAFGRTVFAGGAPVSGRTLFRIYSMTKPLTGIAVMQAVAAGRMTLDTPLGALLPEFGRMQVLIDPQAGLAARPAERPILVRHLLTHTAGFTYHIAGDGPLEREYRRQGLLPIGSLGLGLSRDDGPVPDLDGFVSRLAALPLYAEPGTVYRYSLALDLAGGLLQRLAGRPFDQLLEAQLLGPLGMRDTGFTVPESAFGRLSALYAWVDPETGARRAEPLLADAPPETAWAKPSPLPAGGAGLVSSAEDYARFAQMLLNQGLFEGRRILPAGLARLAMSNLMPPGVFYQKIHGYGAGGSVTLADTRATGPEGQPPGVFGWGGAAGTLFQVDPVRDVAVVLMLQHLPAQAFPTARRFATAANRDFG